MPRKPLPTAVAVLLLLVYSGGCYHYRIATPEENPATEWKPPKRKVVHALAWGLLNKPQSAVASGCETTNSLDQVRITTNLGYTIITVLTLGFWSPLEVEWRCSKEQQRKPSERIE